MRHKTLLLPLLAACMFYTGCYHVNHKMEGSTVPMSVSAHLGREYEKVSDFDVSEKKGYLFWGLIPLSDLNGAELATEQLNQSDGIANLSINTSFDLLDWLIGLLTVGIFTTQDIDAHGDLVKFRDRPTTVVVQPPAAQPNVIIQPNNQGELR